MLNIQSVTPTICSLMGVNAPALCTSGPIAALLEIARNKNISTVGKCLLYAPDAVGGTWLYDNYRECFKPVESYSDLKIEISSVFPPKTPVCFASMFTGADPSVHGVVWPDRPVLSCDTVFDAMIRAGKKVAIVAVEGSSIEKMYRGRALDYYSEKYDDRVISTTCELLKRNIHDFIVVYNQEYDDMLHQHGPESVQALKALQKHCKTYQLLAEYVDLYWAKHDRLLTFAPDHGGHYDEAGNRGAHGDNIPEDMHLLHFYRVHKKEAF